MPAMVGRRSNNHCKYDKHKGSWHISLALGMAHQSLYLCDALRGGMLQDEPSAYHTHR